MSDTPPFYVWPVADQFTLTLAMLALVGLFAAAIALEFYRRRRDRVLRLQAEWRAVRELSRDREIADGDWSLLKAIITQYASETPYNAVTKRKLFDECMQRYFKALWATAKEDEVAHRGMQLRDIRRQLGLDYVPLGQRIQSTRELQTGQSMWAAQAQGHEPVWRHFTVSDIDEACFVLELVGSEPTPGFAAGDLLKFRFWREEDARYVFDAPVYRVTADRPTWKVAHVESLTRNQARAHFRVAFDETVTVSVLNAPLNDDYDDIARRPPVTQVRGRITSLSGGGLAVAFQQPVPKQVLLRIPISVPNHEEQLTVYVRPVGTRNLSGGRSLLRGKFVAMDDDVREIITRCIFMKQKLNSSDDRI